MVHSVLIEETSMLDMVKKIQESGKLVKIPRRSGPPIWPIPPKKELSGLIDTLGTLQDVANYYGVSATTIYRFKNHYGIERNCGRFRLD